MGIVSDIIVNISTKPELGIIDINKVINSNILDLTVDFNEENIVKGFVLKGEKKIGYILLPGFYTEWDIKKVIKKVIEKV